MGVDGTDANPLRRAEFYALYHGGLSVEDDQRRLAVLYVLLGSGRLGLRPDELRHLHEGWIDWERGTVTVPDHEPCSCPDCWDRAARTMENDQNAIQRQWTPQDATGRTVNFGWSHRITAVLATVLDQQGHLDERAGTLAQLVETAAEGAEGLGPETVDFETLTATASRFFAAAGCDADAIARLVSIGDATARQYAREWGTATADKLTRRLGDGTMPTPARRFPVVCDPTPFEREPFDPGEFDTRWRVERASEKLDEPRPLETPHPPRPPADVSTAAHSPPGKLDKYSQHVQHGQDSHPSVSALPELMQDSEATRGGALARTDPDAATATAPTQGTDTAGSGTADADGPGDDQMATARERITGYLVAEIQTTFAVADLNEGKPGSGTVLLGEEELIFVTEDDQLRIDFLDVTDVAVDYIPDELERVFDSTVGVSYRIGSSKRPGVIELAGDQQRTFATQLLSLLLDGTDAIATHPARVGGRVTNNPPREGTLDTDPHADELRFVDDDEGEFRIALSEVIHVERGKQAVPDGMSKALIVRHVTDGEAKTTELSTEDHRSFKLLDRLVMRSYRRRRQQVDRLSLSADDKEVLVALYSAGGNIDISMVIDKDQAELDAIIERLEQEGLVEQGAKAPELTGLGQMVVSEKVDDINI